MKDYIKSMRKHIGHRPLMFVGAGVIVYQNEAILLQRRKDNNLWAYHGGALEINEVIEDAAKRELYEETGLTAKKLTLFHVYSGPDFYHIYPNGDEAYIIDCVHLCTDFEGELHAQVSEVSELKWFHFSEIDFDTITPHNRRPLRDFINFYRQKGSKPE